MSGATETLVRDISKAFDRIKFYGISGQIFGLALYFFSNRRLRMVRDGKTSQEYPAMAEVSQGSILGPTLFLL